MDDEWNDRIDPMPRQPKPTRDDYAWLSYAAADLFCLLARIQQEAHCVGDDQNTMAIPATLYEKIDPLLKDTGRTVFG